MTQSAEVLAIRDALAQRFPNAQPVLYRTAGAISTGQAALDALLPGGGLPRGRLTLWQVGGGATALLRSACSAVVRRGERSAWVDGQRAATGDGWEKGPLLLRPASELNALSCAEELLRCGGFALVVLSGVSAALERETVRLSRAVKEGGGALVVLAPHTPVAHLRISSRIRPDGYRWKLNPFGEPAHVEAVRIRIEANAMGWSGHTELNLAVHAHAQRAAMDPLLRDRRGAKKRTAKISKDKCERR